MKGMWSAVALALTSLAIAKRQPAIAQVASLCAAQAPRVQGSRVAPDVQGSRWRGPAFSLIVPRGFEPLSIQGIDSEVGWWADTAGHAIAYDYGAGMNLEYLRARLVNYTECQDSIGGFPILLTVGYDTAGRTFSVRGAPQYVAIAHWRERQPGPFMVVGVTSPNMAGLSRGLGVIRSVRFH